MQQNLVAMFEASRMGFETEVLVDDRPPSEVIVEQSQGADLVLLGMARPDDIEDFAVYYQVLIARFEELPTVAFVLASESIEFGEILA